jgi:hypothetical protein
MWRPHKSVSHFTPLLCLHKIQLSMLAAFNTWHLDKVSRILNLQQRISFVSVWTQLEIEHEFVTNQLQSKELTKGSRQHLHFSARGEARFPAWHSSAHSTYFRRGSYQALVVTSQWVWHWPTTIAILETQESAFHRDNAVSQQMAPLRSSRCAQNEDCLGTFLDDEVLSTPSLEPQPQQWKDTRQLRVEVGIRWQLQGSPRVS